MSKETEWPFTAIGGDELGDEIGNATHVGCPGCGEEHVIKYGEEIMPDGTRKPSKLLAFVSCDRTGKSYLVGIGGKLLK